MNKTLICSFALIALIMASCAPKAQKPIDLGVPTTQLPEPEQTLLALDKMTELIVISQPLPREAYQTRNEQGLLDIIKNYPSSFLAEEAHHRLVRMYLREYTIPRIREAEALYRSYVANFNPPNYARIINEEFMRFYYIRGYWQKLSDFVAPYIREYVKNNNFKNPLYVYYYAESKYNLGDYAEAEKGYKIIFAKFKEHSLFPNAKSRIEELKLMKENKSKQSN